MPGLVPGIHVLGAMAKKDVDGRDKPGHDEYGRRLSKNEEQKDRMARYALRVPRRQATRYATAARLRGWATYSFSTVPDVSTSDSETS
jgi:hypothetical protein